MKTLFLAVCIILVETFSFKSFSQTWIYYNSQSGFDNVMSCFIQDHNGFYWIGSVNSGVYRFDGSTFTKTSSSADNDEILAITNIQDTVWAASNNGLIRLVNGSSISKQVITYSSDITKNVFTSIAADSNKVLWIGGGDITGYQLLNYASQKWTTIVNDTAGFLHNITCIAVDTKNNIWVCSDGGLSKYNGTKWTNYNTHNSGLTTGSLRSVVFDSKSNIWIGI